MRGLEDQNRVKQVKTWLNKTKNAASIICIQEMMIKEAKLSFKLKLIDIEATQVMDRDVGGWVGAAMLIPNCFNVIAIGKKGDSSFVWAT